MKKYKIGLLIGSLRKESFNRKVAMELIKLAPESLDIQEIAIGDLPFYNEDLDTDNPPAAWTRFREAVKGVDGVLLLTPEYNRSYSAVIKNALDVASRPYGKNVLNGKPGAIASVTMSGLGAMGANHHLRQPMVFLNVLMMQQPEAYIATAQNLFDKEGNLTVDSTRQFLKSYIDAYAKWVQKIVG